MPPREVLAAVAAMDGVLGLNLLEGSRADLRLRPKGAAIGEAEIDDALARRKAARGGEGLRHLGCDPRRACRQGVEVMDGDPLGWEWKL